MMTLQHFADDLAQDYLRTYQAPGLAVGIVRKDAILLRAGYGTTRIGSGNPVTPRTLFHMASVTKPLVASAVMQLVEQGRIELDAPLLRYMPDFLLADPRGREITIRQLLTHTAGLPDVENYEWDAPQYDSEALARYLRSLSSLRLLSAPGARFAYSDIGFNVLGALIATVSGLIFEHYMAQHLLQPLGMRSSSLELHKVDSALLARPHQLDERGHPQECKFFPYNRPHAGSSTLISNLEDMTRWVRTNLGGGELDGVRVLRAESHESMCRALIGNVHPAIPRNGHIGLSWFVFHRNGMRLIGHMGQDDGFASLLLFAPDADLGLVAMANRSHDYAQPGLWALHFRLIDRLSA